MARATAKLPDDPLGLSKRSPPSDALGHGLFRGPFDDVR